MKTLEAASLALLAASILLGVVALLAMVLEAPAENLVRLLLLQLVSVYVSNLLGIYARRPA